MNELAEKIRAIRQKRGLSQEEFARQMGVSFPTVNAWERGRSKPYPRHQKAINDIYEEVVQTIDRQTVLIVEDDEDAGLVLADYTAMALPDWQVINIDNGYDAVLQIGIVRPGIVLLDIMMPQIDGLEVFRRIRQLEALEETRVIFVTAATDEAILAQARNAGAHALIQKPLNREEITQALTEAAGVKA